MLGEKYDCEATLNDEGMIEFCKNGFMMLEAVVPSEVNLRATEFLDSHPQMQPTEILEEKWFVDAVIKNPQAAGAVRSLLGRDFKLPAMMSNHRVQCPQTSTGGWHRDGGAVDSNRLDSLQVFYYPQDTPAEMGPTEVLPSSHLLRVKRRYMTQYGSIRQAVRTVAPAGLHLHHPLLHLAPRHHLHRQRHPQPAQVQLLAHGPAQARPGAADPGCDFTEIQFGTGRNMPEKWHDSVRVVRLFLWLCGGGEFAFSGGQSWPITCGSGNHIAEGMPPELQPRG